jgi:ABC-type Fe3+-hydroxamate transport system substrate-binding protein
MTSPRVAITFAVFLLFNHLPTIAQISISDDMHRKVSLPKPAQRIVSLAPSITESLFAIGAGDQVAGVTDYCTYPPAARRKPRVGGMINPSIETIVNLVPDLIVLSMEGNARQDFFRLTSLGVPVFVTNPRSIDGIYQSLRALGTITGRADSAEQVIAALRRREDAVHTRLQGVTPVRSLLFVSLQPLMCAGSATFLNELLHEAGAVNLAERTSGTYPSYSRERVIANDPDVILLTSDLLVDPAMLTTYFPEWQVLTAVRHHRVYRVDADMVSRPGPRAIDALESLFYLLHSNP